MTIEALIDDGRHDVPYWSVSSVESNANGYYIVGHSNVKLEDLTVRRRGRV